MNCRCPRCGACFSKASTWILSDIKFRKCNLRCRKKIIATSYLIRFFGGLLSLYIGFSYKTAWPILILIASFPVAEFFVRIDEDED
jgi:hypothetical protein